MFRRILLTLVTFCCVLCAYGDQDIDLHLSVQLLQGKRILHIKHDFFDPYLFVLAEHNEVYRVNTDTREVKDYTALLSLYNTQGFVDIAGYSGDEFFVATGTAVLHIKNGFVAIMGAAEGIGGEVNSLGIGLNFYHSSNVGTLYVGTANGIVTYDIVHNQKGDTAPSGRKTVIFESSYLRLIFGPEDYQFSPGSAVNLKELFFATEFGGFGEYTWHNNTLGEGRNTVYEIPPAVAGAYDLVSYRNLFWGNEKGLFQVASNMSHNPESGYGHYLDNIRVNKISDIYGLVTFGNTLDNQTYNLIRQNMLVGTDQGLYYTGSLFKTYGGGTGSGSLRKFTLYHYDPLGNGRVNDIAVRASGILPALCQDQIWIAKDDGLYMLKPDYSHALATGTQLQAVHFENQDIKVKQKTICEGTITAMVEERVLNANTIQWYKDGAEIPGESHNKLIISEAGNYSALIYDPCSAISLKTNQVRVDLAAAPVFSLVYPDHLPKCSGTSKILTVTGSSDYHYRWYRNGVLNGNKTQNQTAVDPGSYKVEVSSCDNGWISSKTVQVEDIALPVPVLNVDKPTYCNGERAVLKTNLVPDASYTFNWFRDNTQLTGKTNAVEIEVADAGSYIVKVSNALNCDQQSEPLSLIFDAPPEIKIERTLKTSLCEGTAVELKAIHATGTVKWTTGETGDLITVTVAGQYSATVTSPAGCTNTATESIGFNPNPVLNLTDQSICPFLKETKTLVAPEGFKLYRWNGTAGGRTFQAIRPEKITLEVEDFNGCTARQEINISARCPEVYIPNTFTPNGDGVNDTWDVLGLEGEASATVNVFNRYGTQLFSNRGHDVYWDGFWQGKKLPSGVYFYVITHNGKKLSGWVNIIY